MAKKSTTRIQRTSQIKGVTKVQDDVKPKGSTKVQEAVKPKSPTKDQETVPPQSPTKAQEIVPPKSSVAVSEADRLKNATGAQEAVQPTTPTELPEPDKAKIETKIPEGESVISVPSNLLSGVFSSVTYFKCNQEVEVIIRFLFPPADEWNTVVAIDYGESMQSLFGKTLTGDIPLEIQERYHLRNLVFDEKREGGLVRFYQPEAYEDAIANGYLKWTKNEIDPETRKVIEFLSTQIDSRELCNLMFWGCEKGLGWVDLGEISPEDLNENPISGPETSTFGRDPKLLPLVQYLVTKFLDVPRTLVVILTDGNFSDVEEVKDYCITLALLIKAKERNFMRFVLIGIGKEINQNTISELKGMKISPTAELWNYKKADEIEEFGELFQGLLSDEEIVAPHALILDANGKIVKKFEGGLPAKTSFRMPIDSTSFSIQFPPKSREIRQSLLLPFKKTLF